MVSRSPGVRTSFLLVLLFGVVVPLGIVGWWLTRATQKSGRDLLLTRLEETLGDIVLTIGRNWVDQRSNLLRLAETEIVRAALTEGRTISPSTAAPGWPELESAWVMARPAVDRVTFYDNDEVPRVRLPTEDGAEGSTGARYAPSVLPLRLDVYGRADGVRVGTMEVRLRTTSLLPSELVLPGLGGSVLALFDIGGMHPLMPIPFDARLIEGDRFTWAGETWLTVRDTLHEPPLQVTLSAPLGALGQPFESAARRGLIALLVVAMAAFTIATIATQRITRPLAHLAGGADTVASGDLDVVVNEEGPDEIRRVARAFNTMTTNLQGTLLELSQRESLAAVGEFAASLAHEVRNPLTAIRLDLERAQNRIDGGGTARQLLDQALNEVQRLDASVTDALRLARSGLRSPVKLDLRQPLEAAFRVAEPVFRSRAAELVELTLPAEPVLVNGEPGALEQLFLNLLLNAAHAVGVGGRAGVDLRQDSRLVRISIWDEGKGIVPEDMNRIFEPFYSTSHEGTGLGLPIAQRIARAHGGEVEIESNPGRGTTARVTLRALDSVPREPQ